MYTVGNCTVRALASEMRDEPDAFKDLSTPAVFEKGEFLHNAQYNSTVTTKADTTEQLAWQTDRQSTQTTFVEKKTVIS